MNRQELVQQIKEKQSFLCVGLDTDIKKIPQHLLNEEDPIFAFNKAIIDATAPYCVSYKPNLAFYEAFGVKGIIAFEKTVKYLKENYPKHFDVDALTVAPYMGDDSVMPFLGYEGKWVVLLALTSNKGSYDFQLTEDKNGEKLFEKVLRKSQKWGDEDNLMFVVGATQGRMFEDVRRIAPRSFLLVPGVGAQGGSLEEVCRFGLTDDCGLLVNSSRGIIYASQGEDFAEVAAQKAKELQQQMECELAKI